ncbi:hypothetical protein AAG570_011907 [Ranatra chinensis]|uniref:Sialin n=1 Tax=Ranatra chinensis TaxID=642074 RepID=A0ABD0YH93_9HEMI
MGVMGFLGMACAYIMRACLSISITQMVIPRTQNTSTGVVDPDSCPYDEDVYQPNSTSHHVFETGEFDWDEETQGLILSSFYWGYIITHLPGGMLAQKFGGKHTLGLGILSTAIFTLITPVVSYRGSGPMIALRFFMGIGEGTTFPALSTLLAQWAPPLERSKLAALVFAGVQIGTVLSSVFGGLILEYSSGWPNVFYIFGGIGVLWFVVWCLICYNDPSSHPFISDKEKQYILETIGETERKKDLGGTPWLAIITSGPVWALTITEIGHDYGLYTMVTDLPKYMNDVMHFNITNSGFLSALPYLVMWIFSIIFGYVADLLLAKKLISLTPLRKILSSIGAIGPAVGVIAASYAGCDKAAAATLFTIGMGFMSLCYASLRVNSLDLSPNFAGTIMAIVNGAGSISGMVAPYIIGVLTPNRTLKEWRVVFWVMFGVMIITNFTFIFFGSGEIQHWNEPAGPAVVDEAPPTADGRRRRSTISGGEPIREKFKNYYENKLPVTDENPQLELSNR